MPPRAIVRSAVVVLLCAVGIVPIARGQGQPNAEVAISDTAGLFPFSKVGGPQPLDAFLSEPLGGCVGSGEATAGVGLPSAPILIDAVSAANSCVALPTAADGTTQADDSANGILVYMVKGPAALAGPFHATLSEHLHGTLSTSKGIQPDVLGGPNTGADLTAYAEVGHGISGNRLSVGGSARDGGGFGVVPAEPPFVDQSTATQAIYGIDDIFTQDVTSGPVAYLYFHLQCTAFYSFPRFADRPAASPSCVFDYGDSAASLAARDSGVIFERVAPLRRTVPRSAAYLSPAAGPIETFPGTAGVPSTASGSGDLGQGATGDSSAAADLPLATSEIVDTTGAASHVDQSAVTADAGATVTSEGQGAASLRYHVTFLNGAMPSSYPNGFPLRVEVPTVSATLTATKGLDPSIVEHVSFQIAIDVQGAPFFHFVTLSLGSSDEDPPGLSGDLVPLCFDGSTPADQICLMASSFADPPLNAAPLNVLPDARGDLALTVQTDCATALTHPSGPLPAAHLACDASHTVTAKLVSTDANVLLSAVPEPDSGALAVASVVALGAVARSRTKAIG